MAQWLSVALLVVLSSLGCWLLLLLVVSCCLLVVGCSGLAKGQNSGCCFCRASNMCTPSHGRHDNAETQKKRTEALFFPFPHFPCPFLIWPTAPDAISISIDEFHLCSIY